MAEDPAKKDALEDKADVGQQNIRPLDDPLKLVNEESNRLIGWALLIIGGSLLAVFSNDYTRLEGNYKKIYFLYVLGWLLLCISIYFGQLITRNYLASVFVNKDHLPKIEMKINHRFKKQIDFFFAGVTVFAVWLIIFLILWILNR